MNSCSQPTAEKDHALANQNTSTLSKSAVMGKSFKIVFGSPIKYGKLYLDLFGI